MDEALDTAGLLALLDAGETVLFPSPRAAAALGASFDRAQRARGLHAWEPPRTLAWQQWVESLWSSLTLEGADVRLLLNRLQEESVWAAIISASPEVEELTRGSLQQLAALSRSALALAGAHLADDQLHRLQRTADTYDARAFGAWQRLFAQHCHEDRLLSPSLLENALAEHVRCGNLPLPSSLHLVGFEEFTPAQTRLTEQCRAAGTRIVKNRLVHRASLPALRAAVFAPSPQEELRWAVCWIKQQFDQGSEVPPSIALLVPDPVAERGELEPLLREVLAPELESVHTDLSSTPWHFSSGLNLALMAPIQHALTLLRWISGALPLEEVGTLLLSPYLGHTDTFEARARFEMHTLRRAKRLRPELTLPELLRLARRPLRADASVNGTDLRLPELEAVHRFAGDPGVLTGNGSHADWAELVRKLLRLAGWPGPRTPSASEFRATEAWESLLDLLATLDFNARRLTFATFLDQLTQRVASLPAPSAIAHAPIAILTLSETEGCSFDAVLMLRATDANLPALERLHPLLGREFQRTLGLPGTDPNLAHVRTRERVHSLGERCGDLLLLAATADEHGPLRPTPLLADLGLTAMEATMEAKHLFRDETATPPLVPELIPERSPRLPLTSLDVHGGARLLELQAACGFRAFASLRLQANAPEIKTLGLNARERGNILHRALEHFWTEVKSQAALKALGPEDRRSAVRGSVRRALEGDRTFAAPDDRWAGAYLDVSEQRLCTLLEQWLAFELERTDFTVLAPEQEQRVQVGPFELKVRPDRIDRVEGGFVLVDYKTSSDLSTEHWLGDRPQAPQLPLYTLLGEAEEVRGLAFAKIRPGTDMKWIGLQKQEGDLRKHRSTKIHDLEYQVVAWREELNRLASEFAEGIANLDPKSYPTTCKYCDQRLLCRLDTAALLSDADADDNQSTAGEEHDG